MTFVWRRRAREPQPVDWSLVDSRTLRLIVLPVIAAALLAACDAPGPAPGRPRSGETDITDEQLGAAGEAVHVPRGAEPAAVRRCAAEGETQEAVCNRFTLGNMIQGEFVDRYASEPTTSRSKATEVDDIMANLDEQLTAETVDAELDEARAHPRPISRSSRIRCCCSRRCRRAVAEEELGDERAASRSTTTQILRFTTIEALHILVDTEAEADDVYQQVTAPDATQETFEDLAKDVSTDTASGANGGSLGQAVASTYVPEFGEAAVALEPGQISEPVQSEFGWHVIYLVDEQVTPFEEAKTQLLSGEQGTLFNAWMREQAESLGVEVNPTYGPVRRRDADGRRREQHRPERNERAGRRRTERRRRGHARAVTDLPSRARRPARPRPRGPGAELAAGGAAARPRAGDGAAARPRRMSLGRRTDP